MSAPEVPADPGPDPERACAQAELSYQFARTLGKACPQITARLFGCAISKASRERKPHNVWA